MLIYLILVAISVFTETIWADAAYEGVASSTIANCIGSNVSIPCPDSCAAVSDSEIIFKVIVNPDEHAKLLAKGLVLNDKGGRLSFQHNEQCAINIRNLDASDNSTYIWQCGRNCTVVKLFVKKTKACESNPCQNEGICQEEVSDYKCQCRDNYVGVNCESRISECTSVFPIHFMILISIGIVFILLILVVVIVVMCKRGCCKRESYYQQTFHVERIEPIYTGMKKPSQIQLISEQSQYRTSSNDGYEINEYDYIDLLNRMNSSTNQA